MAKEVKLIAKKRSGMGTAECRRLRRQGITPGNIYGHKQEPIPISVAADELAAILHSGQRVLECEIDGVTDTTMFREVQWDTWGADIQHFDLIRIDADERVEVHVSIELRGTSPGVLGGGILQTPIRELALSCLASQIPDSIVVRISNLEIGQAIHISDLEFPADVFCEQAPESTVVQVTAPVEEADEDEEAAPEPVEPEVIGQKKDEEEE